MLGDRRGILHHSHVPTTMWWPIIGHQLPMIPRKIQENPRVQNSSLQYSHTIDHQPMIPKKVRLLTCPHHTSIQMTPRWFLQIGKQRLSFFLWSFYLPDPTHHYYFQSFLSFSRNKFQPIHFYVSLLPCHLQFEPGSCFYPWCGDCDWAHTSHTKNSTRVSPLLLTNSAHLGPISGLGLIVNFSRSSLTNFNIATNLAMARVQLLFHSTVLLESALIFSSLWWQERVAF